MPSLRLAARITSTWDTVRGSYWFVPSWMALASVAAAALLLEADHRVDRDWALALPWIHQTTAEGSRAVVGVVAGSMITVTGVVFSITIVALTLASSQFGPRLLRNFMRDRANQLVLGTFVATFLFNLLVLSSITAAGAEGAFVPYLSTAAGIGLGIVSLFVLIFFIHHAASSIQAANVIAAVVREIECSLPLIFPESIGEGAGDERPEYEAALRERMRSATPVLAEATGYIRVLDADGLLETARGDDVVVSVECSPGEFVRKGQTLAYVEGAEVSPELADRVRATFATGPQRTAVQDLGFLTQQLTEMAVRALSPGINDPNTAVACIRELGVVLATLAERRFPSALRCDDEGELRVLAPSPDFGALVRTMWGPIRHYGAADPEVAMALLEAVAWALPRARKDRRAALVELGQDTLRAAHAAGLSPGDAHRLEIASKSFSATDKTGPAPAEIAS